MCILSRLHRMMRNCPEAMQNKNNYPNPSHVDSTESVRAASKHSRNAKIPWKWLHSETAGTYTKLRTKTLNRAAPTEQKFMLRRLKLDKQCCLDCLSVDGTKE